MVVVLINGQRAYGKEKRFDGKEEDFLHGGFQGEGKFL
jgi:hypothetical protein